MYCIGNVFLGCNKEIDDKWKIPWPTTNINSNATQKCPGGSESLGKLYILLCLATVSFREFL